MQRQKVFVLMPFDQEFNDLFSEVIKPSFEEIGYIVERADSLLDRQNILRDIVRGIAVADLIVADLTSLNPNVIYELGLGHGLRIPTIILTQQIEDIPFDLRSYRIEVYSTHFSSIEKLKDTLIKIGEKHRNQEINFGSPIIDFLPSEYKLKYPYAIENKNESITQVPECHNYIDDEKGFLDFILEGENAMKEFGNILSEITTETNTLTESMKLHTSQLNNLSLNPGPGTAS